MCKYLWILFTILLPLTAGAQDTDDTARVGHITAAQQQRIVERTEVLKLWSFSFGPGEARSMNNDGLFYSFMLARHWEVNENAEIRANLHTTLPSKRFASFTSFGVGGSWLMLPTDISPILGGEIGYGYASIPDLPDRSGFMGGIHGGVRLFRTARAQMGLEGYYKTIFSAGPMPADYGATLSVLF